MSFLVVIPARYGSTRLPGKPMLLIAGKPLVQHVYNKACQSAATDVVIATDDARIAELASNFGAKVCITSAKHQSGSDRIAEVLEQLAWADDTCIVNLQGDEPCMPVALINQVAIDLQAHPNTAMATVATQIQTWEQVFDPNVVKVITNINNYALYFSRAPIPWYRELYPNPTPTTLLPTALNIRRHIGLYAYRAGFLRRYVSWSPPLLETAECLEQLRVLWYGEHIYVGTATQTPGPGIDTAEDLARLEASLINNPDLLL